jgi:hypothetical protein
MIASLRHGDKQALLLEAMLLFCSLSAMEQRMSVQKEICWVCDGMPVAKACPSCLGAVTDPLGKSICSRCQGRAIKPIKCPACQGNRYADPPRRADKDWVDPLECGVCCGMPHLTSTGGCDTCGNRGRIYLVFPETDHIDELRQCLCVASPLHDPHRGAVEGCPLCGGYGVMYIVRRMFLDAHVARHFLVNPPDDLAYAFLVREWSVLGPVAPPLWPWEDATAKGGAA